MTTKLTRSEVLALKPCDLSKVPEFGDLDRMGAREALDAGVSISDLLWVAGALGMKRQCVQFALECAQRVAHLNPDPRVKVTLDAVAAWLADPSEENRQWSAAATTAATTAAEAAEAAWGARTAADAAWAAAWAARAAWRAREHRVCAGCGTSHSRAELDAAGKVSCCPERNMIPVTEEWSATRVAEAAWSARSAAAAAELWAAEVDAQREIFLRLF